MRLSTRNDMVLLLAIALATGGALLATRSSAHASAAPQATPLEYHAPTGPELSPTAGAQAAIAAARAGADVTGTIDVRVAHGTFAQARAVLDEGEAVYGPTTSGQASCFPGLACNSAAVEESERVQREEDESGAYIVEMSGAAFSPPADRLKKGETASSASGEIETIIVDAHTGFPEERTIGSSPRKLEALGQVTELTATIPSDASAPAEVVRGRSVYAGVIVGRVMGSKKRDLPIVLSEAGVGANPREGHEVRHATTSSKGTFRMSEILRGRYTISVQRPKCLAKKIAVKAAKTTDVTLVC